MRAGMQLESILIHEFGHVIHGAGFDEELRSELTAAFEQAKARGSGTTAGPPSGSAA